MEKEFNLLIYIKDNYSDLLDHRIYEPILEKIMNDSKKVFPDTYERIIKQDRNQSDFVSKKGKYYDAKLLFDQEQCSNISNSSMDDFISTLQKETDEIYNALQSKNHLKIMRSKLYSEVSDRISRANKKEDIVLFLPFAFTLEVPYLYNTLDIFSLIFKIIKKYNTELINGHEIYAIYPNYKNQIVLKNLTKNKKEYLDKNYLSKYIKYDMNDNVM